MEESSLIVLQRNLETSRITFV